MRLPEPTPHAKEKCWPKLTVLELVSQREKAEAFYKCLSKREILIQVVSMCYKCLSKCQL